MPAAFQVPHLDQGQTYRGPDYYGCSDSGFEPVIHHVLDGVKRYIVCHGFDLGESLGYNSKPRDCRKAKQSVNGYRIYLFDDLLAARETFQLVCQAVIEANRAAHKKALAVRVGKESSKSQAMPTII